ncbi:MAG: hypothetical protein GY832_39290 [Chloroflexi bacterium]|nr:hypothetical protein [Chloroflexota bacterium]
MMTIWARLRFWVFQATDRLLGTHLVEQEMVRLQHHVEMVGTRASDLHQQIEDLNLLLHVVQLQMCVLYLHQRQILRPATWLRFIPDEGPDEEKSIDILVNRLVKHKLATIRTEADDEGTYIYHLRPDWKAIGDLLSNSQGFDNSVIVTWLEKIRSDNIYG